MITCGFPRVDVEVDLRIAARLGAELVEILPDWRNRPDPHGLKSRIEEKGLAIHSVHGCWGGQSIEADRVDLADPDPAARTASVDDLRRCLDWLDALGGRCLVVHPGGLSYAEDLKRRREALASSLVSLADHVSGTSLRVCVENMPPGVFPGSRMRELRILLEELKRPELGLAIDTGHANLNATAEEETLQAGSLLRTSHVHDNLGKFDSHDPPGSGTISWTNWVEALDRTGYEGPIILECIRHIRNFPESLDGTLAELLVRLCRQESDTGKRIGS
jgi:sugar phosphate isomerase/epimerase